MKLLMLYYIVKAFKVSKWKNSTSSTHIVLYAVHRKINKHGLNIYVCKYKENKDEKINNKYFYRT